jgi:uncharacterized delta-60 repeat protein
MPAFGQAPDSFNPGADNSVLALAVQTDGKVLAGGRFYSALGGAERHYLGRLNSGGSLDTAYNPGADGAVYCLALQPDGKALAGGLFSNLGGQSCNCLGRLNSDGTFDASFNAQVNSFGYVYSLAVQPDGKVLAGGFFTTLSGQPCNYLGRLNPDGSFDTNFNAGAESPVFCLSVQPDGKVLAGGASSLGRFNSDGTPDPAFTGATDGEVFCVALQSDGKILVGGVFNSLGGFACTNLGRLNSNGTLDLTFFGSADGPVYTLAVQADGLIFAGGSFANLSGSASPNLGRMYANGLLDLTYNPGADNSVLALNIQSDGNVLAGGDFMTLLNQSRSRIGRFSNIESATQSLSFGGSTVTWARGGASPEIWSAVFDYTTNGATWTSLGAGARIAGGWQLTGVPVPVNASVRARGYVSGGQYNGSGSLVETITGPVVITRQPDNAAADAGTAVSFSVLAGGTAPLSYRWRKNGALLGDGGSISGSQTATLTLNNVLGVNIGGYSVIATNASGSVTSSVAFLTVRDPVIITQPASQDVNSGQTAAFSVTAAGTPTLSYQWRKNTTNYLAGATAASFVLTNVQGSDGGNYDVVVTSTFGAVTSAVAVLTVDVATADAFAPDPSGFVYAIAVQADGEILAGGSFTNLAGLPCSRIGRLGPDGNLDASFLASAGGTVYSLAVQPDGKILAGGQFTSLNGLACTNLGRLNPDGSLDTNFVARAGTRISSLAVQTDGKILVGGVFTSLGGRACTNLGRLNPDGTPDTNFNSNVRVTSATTIYTLAVQTDGKILVGGALTSLAGQARTNIGRLNVDGTLDTNFVASASAPAITLAIQGDGKILAGGNFTSLGGYPRNDIGRFNTNGTVDTTFSPGANNYVLSLAVQADGKILVGGQFTQLGGLARTNIGRLSASGVTDAYFNPYADNYVYCLALQTDGKILAGGKFTTLGGAPRNYLARLNNSDAATQALTCDGSTINWLRGGTSPEVWRTSFESSTNGTNWTSLGVGARISGGWQLTGLSLSNADTIRARGFVSGGYFSGASGWFVQTTGQVQAVSVPQLVILVNDGNFGVRSNRFGFNLSSPPGQTVVVDATTNFISWTPIQTNVTTGSGLVSFNDPQWSLFPRRFYRARVFNGVLPPPSIPTAGNGLGFQAGAFGFNVAGIGGQTAVIQASTNLVNWIPLATNILGNGPLHFSDPASTNFTKRFYRVLVQ